MPVLTLTFIVSLLLGPVIVKFARALATLIITLRRTK